ncbi:TIGR00730 family Rossman fold protein [Paracidobacterium acidisoli]|uniref:Cytokinin riboside 5'-monophosphate phosphoribohydrolase n=1 Tax=Paracidobacterium acidisoli TaxID=2303751 RepID=A0A372IQ25_9BACT|nr:TIGR00730 family Rossman fold protein [Paracidobacterium acidisoli]MBT9331397.1 TIGR00730 family Rossman fold protein [Paracidobacterium acidisoli]
MLKSKKWICVFCGSADGASPAYLETARCLGRLIAGQGHGLVYGGATVGAMGAVADAALGTGGEVVGVIPDVIMDREIGHTGLTELHVVRTMHERKALLAERADAFVALPGGYGTLDEFIEILTWAQLRIHAKPCVFVNVGGYYDGLLAFFDRAVAEGFIKAENRGLILVAKDAAEAVGIIERAWNLREEAPAHDARLDELVK